LAVLGERKEPVKIGKKRMVTKEIFRRKRLTKKSGQAKLFRGLYGQLGKMGKGIPGAVAIPGSGYRYSKKRRRQGGGRSV